MYKPQKTRPTTLTCILVDLYPLFSFENAGKSFYAKNLQFFMEASYSCIESFSNGLAPRPIIIWNSKKKFSFFVLKIYVFVCNKWSYFYQCIKCNNILGWCLLLLELKYVGFLYRKWYLVFLYAFTCIFFVFINKALCLDSVRCVIFFWYSELCSSCFHGAIIDLKIKVDFFYINDLQTTLGSVFFFSESLLEKFILNQPSEATQN